MRPGVKSGPFIYGEIMDQALKNFAELCGRILAERWIAEQKLKAEQKASGRGGEASSESAGDEETTEYDVKAQ